MWLVWVKWIVGLLVGFYFLICVLIWFFQENILFHPQVLDRRISLVRNEATEEEIYLQPEPGVNLHGMLFRHPQSKGLILYFHGNAGSLLNWAEVGRAKCALGYDVFVYDYRGYGKSGGKISYKSLLGDADFIYKYFAQRYETHKIIVFGRSLGSGPAAYVASRHQPDKLVLETPYYSMKSLASAWVPWAPVTWLLRYPLPLHEWMADIGCPILILHGTADEVIPFTHAQQLKSVLKPGDSWVSVPGGRHNNLGQFEVYKVAENSFLSVK